MMAFCFTILCIPNANTTVTTAGSPSGIAATAKLTAVIKICNKGSPRTIPKMKTKIQIPKQANPNFLPNWASFFCKTVPSSSTFSNMVAIEPISVFIPV